MAYAEKLLTKCNSLPHIKQLQAHLITTGLFKSYFSRSKLLDFCATSSAGSLSYATFIFNHIPHPATNDWNAIIRGLAQSRQPLDAVTCYVSMRRARCTPDALTCSFTLKACARALARIEALQFHGEIVKFGVGADVLLQTTLLDAYAKCGDLNCASVMFEEMTSRDIASWNAMIAGMAQGNRPNEALEFFKRMRENGLSPNEVTVLGALSACSQLGAFKEGEKIYDYIRDQKLDDNVNVCNAVIDMFGKCGFVNKAFEVFSGMKCRKTLITWNTMVMAYAMHGDGVKALELFKLLERDGLGPDSVSYLAALCACNHAGLVDEGLKLFESMEESGVDKNVKHYGSVVDLLGRAGRLEQAYKIIASMPTYPDVVLWQTLLGACKTYGNVEMAEKASRKLVEMGSRSCGDFVLLSNLYASHGRWNDVGRVREAMKNRAVKKIPGFSYTEVGGVIYKFINGDQSHPNWRDIYQKLDEIRFRISECGYVPETNNVLHDIGHEDKENVLGYHSEKLAVAFALISTSAEVPISVNKNLRICGDCHTAIKLISKIYKREIIVRDRTRFHKFKNGSCTCRDYW
ncbi:pentatricopeptide repeat-containing protein At1g34160 [Coffea eugenioides]|uniref:Pentatricopeptide repeat-containing protein At1g34160-like n=1 Tax=Coffea arabica TaxID=13443 RepID=A0A6P6V043_COFAR|nr:pentatricopeptide repeat-containing protein At1g34160-like [Coffea arabica]XP_027148501.1 pentatricopeptide repeat-containing protein At1g34160 [Coffea eugenioides]